MYFVAECSATGCGLSAFIPMGLVSFLEKSPVPDAIFLVVLSPAALDSLEKDLKAKP